MFNYFVKGLFYLAGGVAILFSFLSLYALLLLVSMS